MPQIEGTVTFDTVSILAQVAVVEFIQANGLEDTAELRDQLAQDIVDYGF